MVMNDYRLSGILLLQDGAMCAFAGPNVWGFIKYALKLMELLVPSSHID